MTQQTTSCSQSKVTCSPRLPLCEQGWEPGLWECCQKGRGPWLFLLGLPSPTPWPFPKSPGAPAEGQSPRASDQLGPEETKGRHPSTASWRRAWARAPLGRRVSCFLLQVPLTCPPLHPRPPPLLPAGPRPGAGAGQQWEGQTSARERRVCPRDGPQSPAFSPVRKLAEQKGLKVLVFQSQSTLVLPMVLSGLQQLPRH